MSHRLQIVLPDPVVLQPQERCRIPGDEFVGRFDRVTVINYMALVSAKHTGEHIPQDGARTGES